MKDSRMTKQFDVDVDESGRLLLPPAVAEKYGLNPGTRVRIEENANGLHLLRPITQLARIYIEPTRSKVIVCINNFRHTYLSTSSAKLLAIIGNLGRHFLAWSS